MIRYSLTCSQGHSFESWFKSAEAFEALETRGLVACAICGGSDVKKALMAPRVSKATPKEAAAEPATPKLSEPANKVEKALQALRKHLDENSTYVGGNFAKEARAIHLGDAPEQMIHGEAKPEEAQQLLEDGIAVAPLPFLPKNRST
ncbi:DUF1178 family protein [Nioella nitratireducens]|uniref:DUF1178 family protein n=1 Tax=Nioella nitratireducens TaxID=1287720 RepID=UPI0008FD141C|nr:DUF1178 family protein [Nioella nitratireducens]